MHRRRSASPPKKSSLALATTLRPSKACPRVESFKPSARSASAETASRVGTKLVDLVDQGRKAHWLRDVRHRAYSIGPAGRVGRGRHRDYGNRKLATLELVGQLPTIHDREEHIQHDKTWQPALDAG